MSLIKIIANGTELDIVKETLTITKENNSFTNDFKVSCSNFPFLIIENSKTIKALGGKDLTSTNKPKIVPVIVEELNEKFYGELQILSYLNGFRKVTLKYASELLTIMDQPISRFMPVVSVIPDELNPTPFTEESDSVITGSNEWSNYVSNFINESYPAVKFNFPMMYWKDKFGADLQSDDDWINYKQHINNFDDNGDYLLNSYSSIDNVITTENINVPAPQIYLLSPIFYALQSLGWTIEGNFANSEFVKRIIILSTKNNLCKTKVGTDQAQLVYTNPLIWTVFQTYSFFAVRYNTYKTQLQYTLPSSGKFLFSWMYKITDTTTDSLGYKKTFVEASGSGEGILLFVNTTNGVNKIFSGTHEFNGTAGDVITISYYNLHQNPPVDYNLSFLKTDETKPFYQFHPTIELGRYTPDWTLGTYINELKKLFNLKVDTDDFRKKLSLNFNNTIIEISEKEIINKSLAIKNYEQPSFSAFRLKFQNDVDTSLWIDTTGDEVFVAQKSDFLEPIENKFKLVPNNGYTAELSEALESKDGIGLMIYNSEDSPFVSSHYVNQTLSFAGQKGIYEIYWKKWLKFRLNASHIELTGYFTEIELSKIQKLQRIYIDRQDYLVSSLEYSETEQSNFEVLLKLESINF